MNLFGIFLVAFSPGIFWLWFFLRRSSYRPAPRKLIAWTFGLGCLSTVPAVVIETVFLDEGIVAQEIEFATIVTSMLLVVGPVEEFCKFAAVRWLAYKSRYFDEPIDGLVYAGAASLGFASLENVIYVLEFGPDVMLLRAPISTLGHLVFGSIWGYGLGLHVQSGYNPLFWWPDPYWRPLSFTLHSISRCFQFP